MRQIVIFLGCSNNYDLLKEGTKRIINLDAFINFDGEGDTLEFWKASCSHFFAGRASKPLLD